MSIFKEIRQPRVLMMKWGMNGRRLRSVLVALSVVLLLALLYSLPALKYLVMSKNETQMRKYSKLYCNQPGRVEGREGRLPFLKTSFRNYTIKQVFMVIRHGDRAPIVLDTLPHSKSVEISCRFNKSWPYYDHLVDMKQARDDFEITGNPRRVVIQERDICVGGQLTPIGFLQHIFNGNFFKQQYKEFLQGFKSPSEILVLSTDYSRTVQSAAALLHGMFQRVFMHKKGKIKIDVQHDKYPESHFLRNQENQAIFCPALVAKRKEIWSSRNLRQLVKVIDPLKKKLSKIFDCSMGELASLDRIIDIFYADLCHGRDLPSGPNKKISYELAKISFELADRFITLKHSPIAEMQTLGILSRIIQELSTHISGNSNLRKKLVLFSGHDTVILPLLVNLGVHDGRWPPYASRVVFELWHDSRERKNKEKLLPDDEFSVYRHYYIRILYNGNPLTSSVKICRGHIVDAELCPVTQFVKYVSDDGFNGKNYFERIKNICIGTDGY